MFFAFNYKTKSLTMASYFEYFINFTAACPLYTINHNVPLNTSPPSNKITFFSFLISSITVCLLATPPKQFTVLSQRLPYLLNC